MAEQAPPTTEEPSEPLFDVSVTMPSGAKLEDIEKRALAAGIRQDRVSALVKALRSVPTAKIGGGVTRERANLAKEQFSKAGLHVEVTPVLGMQAMITGAFDGRYTCPACEKKVVLPENRQCPSCGVFVDKVTDDFLLRRKILEQEKARMDNQTARDARDSEKRLREQLESNLRAKIREELEAQYGGKGGGGLFSGKAGALRAGGLVALLAVAFFGGRGFTGSGWSWERASASTAGETAAKGASPADVDKMLDSVGPKGGGPGGAAPAGGEVALTGDADLDDPLIQAAGGSRSGAKGISVEQAVAAATTLAKSVGNTTAERAMAGGGSAGPGPSGGAGGRSGAGGGTASGAAAGATPAAAGQTPDATGGSGAPAEAAVPPAMKTRLSLEFAKQLAEIGQLPRARQWMKGLNNSPKVTGDPSMAGLARLADLEVNAWSLSMLQESQARQAAEALMTQANALPDPLERAQALGRIAVILSRNGQLPAEASRAFLTQAAEVLKTVTDARQRNAATSDWAVALGEALLGEVTVRAKAGSWSKAQGASSQLETLIKQAPDDSARMRLLAIDSQVKQQLGNTDKSTQSLDAALALAGKIGSVAERAAMMRLIAQLSGAAGHEHMQAALAALQTQAAAKSGLEKAQAYTQLSLLFADAGLRGKSAELAQLARDTEGLKPDDAVVVNTDLIVRGDLATAKVLHGIGLYAESEAVLQRLGGYLL